MNDICDRKEAKESLNRALFQTVFEKDIKKARELIKNGADVNWKNCDFQKFSNCAIHIAAWNGDEGMCNLLCDNGADLEIENQFFNTPLMFASYYGEEKVVKVLLEKGAQVSSISSGTGLTALHKACMQGYPSIAKLLLEHGAIIEALDIKGKTPYDLIGCSGDENRTPTATECDQLKELFTSNSYSCAIGKRFISDAHPEHELSVRLQMSPSPVQCRKCAKSLLPKHPFYCCRSCPKVALCSGCALYKEIEEPEDNAQNLLWRIVQSCTCWDL